VPDRYPPYQTCHRRFQQWVRSGVFEQILQALATDLHERGGIDLSECYIDGTFIVAKKGGTRLEAKRPSGARVRRSWQYQISDSAGLPVAINIASASPHEVTLAEQTISKCFVVDEKPERLVGDRAYEYDSDPLDARLAINYGVEMIAPHRSNRQASRTQDNRPLRRYRRRWKVERLFAWLQNFRHILVRHDYYADNFFGFVQLGCMMILLRRCL
jgi:transposase